MPFILLFILLAAGSAAYIYFSRNADRYTRHKQKHDDSFDVIYLSGDTEDASCSEECKDNNEDTL